MMAATAPATVIDLAWTLVRNRASGRDDILVRWGSREAQLAYWLSFDDVAQLHSVRLVSAPSDMDSETRSLLVADVLAYHKGESVDWMAAK